MGRVLLAGLPAPEQAAHPERAVPEPLTPHTVTSANRLGSLLERTEREGFALVEDELEEGLRSMAVPVRDRTGRVVSAVNVSMHVRRRTVEQTLDTVLPALRATAARIEDDLRVAGRYVAIPSA
jgi:IclR family pca regulon transcriptional regulator